MNLIFLISGEYIQNCMTDLILIWFVGVSSPEGVPYYKVTLNSHIKNIYTELKIFYISAKYTKNGKTFFIYILQVHVTDVTVMPYEYIEATLNSQSYHNYDCFSFKILANILNFCNKVRVKVRTIFYDI